MPEELENPGCLTLPEDYVDERDFKAEEAIKIDETIELPKSFSLGKWIWETNYQGSIGSCTSNSTSHGVQVLAVAKKGVEPTDSNIITPNWKDLWSKMGHNPEKYDGGDYVEKAVSTALKEGIVAVENGDIIKFDAYCTLAWGGTDEDIDKMKRYIYNTNPIVRCMKGNSNVRLQLSRGELTVGIKPSESTGGHAICLVGWDGDGFRFVNSWSKNDKKNPPHKSRFHVTYDVMKKYWTMFNFRMWILYTEMDAKQDPNYLKKKATALIILKALKKIYPDENEEIRTGIMGLSKALRKTYPELNEELPK